MVKRLKYLVGGEWKDTESGSYYEITNSSTGEVMAEAPRCTAEEVDAVLAAAPDLDIVVVDEYNDILGFETNVDGDEVSFSSWKPGADVIPSLTSVLSDATTEIYGLAITDLDGDIPRGQVGECLLVGHLRRRVGAAPAGPVGAGGVRAALPRLRRLRPHRGRAGRGHARRHRFGAGRSRARLDRSLDSRSHRSQFIRHRSSVDHLGNLNDIAD